MNKKIKFFLIVFVVVSAGVFITWRVREKAGPLEAEKEISPVMGTIRNVISTTGLVLPKNRLEIKPPVPGRLESILVKEGQDVKAGSIVAWMSSTERAALLDAARSKGEKELEYWQEAYKPIALLAPINGEVIVATMQPGQTVTTSDAVIVLSDQLIVRAQVDETDIGKVKASQKTIISLDAYPDNKIKAEVEHIYYESKTVNNVTIYEVDLTPDEVPPFFRSGMNTNIDFIESSRDNVLIMPLEAVYKDKDETFVLVARAQGHSRRPVKLGLSDDKNVEVVLGLELKDKIIIKDKKFVLPKGANNGSSPFTPFGARRQSGQNRR